MSIFSMRPIVLRRRCPHISTRDDVLPHTGGARYDVGMTVKRETDDRRTSFGIHVTAIEPGPFRTDWAGRSMTRAARSLDDYDELFTRSVVDEDIRAWETLSRTTDSAEGAQL
ncbi:hypothetical protein M878_01960 [Streptomyces roseochromogenus subsp. oscitans DS 12.976]|uniref:Uncharacterized protein n=1 Tax=Streptomyces roseochromogenus subsp. oscitans DS 12.976 TaxID=1352936 RepID=V6L5H1_STRRC|nr:hypothetical protein M878_01960 [Streptomyces roseochromogenus subsp. oscitans DS 12.976]